LVLEIWFKVLEIHRSKCVRTLCFSLFSVCNLFSVSGSSRVLSGSRVSPGVAARRHLFFRFQSSCRPDPLDDVRPLRFLSDRGGALELFVVFILSSPFDVRDASVCSRRPLNASSLMREVVLRSSDRHVFISQNVPPEPNEPDFITGPTYYTPCPRRSRPAINFY